MTKVCVCGVGVGVGGVEMQEKQVCISLNSKWPHAYRGPCDEQLTCPEVKPAFTCLQLG